VPGQQRSLESAKRMREQLSNELASLINDFGPKIYSDFNEVRLLFISEHTDQTLDSREYSYPRPIRLHPVAQWDCGDGPAALVP
jgi:hypothetical protein